MSIGFSAQRNDFNQALFAAIKEKLQSETVAWLQAAEAADMELLLAMGAVTRKQMEAMPKLVLIQTLSDGYDAVDVEAATELGVYVSYAPGEATGNSDSVAEYAVMLLIAAGRRLNEAIAAMHAGEANKTVRPALAGKTVLIVGLGDIGGKVVDRLRPFEVRLRGVDRTPESAPKDVSTRPLEELKSTLGEADYVVICLRGTKSNVHLFDAEMLGAMKHGAVLVNIARGSLVDGKALADAVQSGKLFAAGIDVVEQEPVKADDPLLVLPAVFLTPHIAGMTDLNLAGTARYVKQVVEQYRHGEKIKSLLNDPENPRGVLKH